MGVSHGVSDSTAPVKAVPSVSAAHTHTTYCLGRTIVSEDTRGRKRGGWKGALELCVPKREELKKRQEITTAHVPRSLQPPPVITESHSPHLQVLHLQRSLLQSSVI